MSGHNGEKRKVWLLSRDEWSRVDDPVQKGFVGEDGETVYGMASGDETGLANLLPASGYERFVRWTGVPDKFHDVWCCPWRARPARSPGCSSVATTFSAREARGTGTNVTKYN